MELQSGKNDWTNFGKVLVLSVSFMLLMAAWLTTAAIEQTILQSVREEDPTFHGDGYLSQAIVNGVFALNNFFAPTIVSIIGVKTSLIVGGCLYILFISNFLYPKSWFLYGSSALVGFGAAPIWVANGMYLTSCSTNETIGKYMGIYWAIQALGPLFGNGFVFWKFQGLNHIDSGTRYLVISIMMGLALMGSITLLFLGNPTGPSEKKIDETQDRENIKTSILKPLRLLSNKHMLLLIPTSMYNGMEFAFFSAIYPTSMAFSEAFGNNTRNLVAVAGLLIGTGSLFGALFASFVIDKLVKSKRNFIVTSCCGIHCVSFILMYINLPNDAPLGPTSSTSLVNPPSIIVAMVCAFLLGMGDGFLSPQMCAAIGVVWPDDPSSAYAIYRFFLAATCASGYFISTLTGLYNQILIFLGLALVGTFCFRINEKAIAKMDNNLRSRKSVV